LEQGRTYIPQLAVVCAVCRRRFAPVGAKGNGGTAFPHRPLAHMAQGFFILANKKSLAAM